MDTPQSTSVETQMADVSSKELTPALSREVSAPGTDGAGDRELDAAVRIKDTDLELDPDNEDDEDEPKYESET